MPRRIIPQHLFINVSCQDMTNTFQDRIIFQIVERKTKEQNAIKLNGTLGFVHKHTWLFFLLFTLTILLYLNFWRTMFQRCITLEAELYFNQLCWHSLAWFLESKESNVYLEKDSSARHSFCNEVSHQCSPSFYVISFENFQIFLILSETATTDFMVHKVHRAIINKISLD